MRLKLSLQALHSPALLPFNYQYPLSAAIYKIIRSADKQFAHFLHQQGYGEGHKSFKLFTFSDIKTPFQPRGDRMQLLTGAAEVIICFYLPQAAETFIRGLFLQQQISIADSETKTNFQVVQVESLFEAIPPQTTHTLQPLSPLVVGKKNQRGHYDYRSPTDADFADCLIHNWLEKFQAVSKAEKEASAALRQQVSVCVKPFAHPPRQRLITLKQGTEAETRVRGYTQFGLEVQAPAELIAVALGAGLGLHNAQGFGCVELFEPGFYKTGRIKEGSFQNTKQEVWINPKCSGCYNCWYYSAANKPTAAQNWQNAWR